VLAQLITGNDFLASVAVRPCVLPPLAGDTIVHRSEGAALQLFANRLASRSILTDEEVSTVLALKGQLKQVAAHVDFVRLGEHVDHSCLLVDGLVGRFGQNRDGVRQITCLHIPGDMADLPSVVSPKSGWALGALTSSTILRIAHTDLRRLAAKHSGIAEAFWRDCVADGSIFSEWVVNVGRRNALSRIAHLLCEMAIRCNKAGQGNRTSFTLPITQADLGDATGLTNIHVNRTLRELRTQGIVELRAGTVTIPDWNRLVSVADFDAAYMLLDGPSLRITEAA
jgi:CRP-like cAMP-binding protein